MPDFYRVPLMLLVIAVAWFDFRRSRIPNRVTHLLLLAGLFLHLPGTPALWFLSVLFLLSWYSGWMGGGDVKLWLALFWMTPASASGIMTLTAGAVFLITGALQLSWRLINRSELTGVSSPAAWRAIPFAVWMAWIN